MSKRKLSNPNLAFGEEDVILEYKKKQYKQSKKLRLWKKKMKFNQIYLKGKY